MWGFDLIYLLAAFAGGIGGAAIGGLNNFIIMGVAALVGPAVDLGIVAATGKTVGLGNYSNWVAWGPFLGPHITFTGAAAAAVYAYSRGKLDFGRNIGAPLMGLNSPDVLLVGGIFGALGYICEWLIRGPLGLGGWIHSIASTVVIVALIARVVFGKTGIFGKVTPGANRWSGNPWLPWQTAPMQLLMIGIGVGLPAAWIVAQAPPAQATQLATVVFGFVTLALVWLSMGQKVSVSHHTALCAAWGVVLWGGDVWWGLFFGILATFLAEIGACLFVCWGDNHVDPPAFGIVCCYTIGMILKAAGLTTQHGIVPIVGTVVVAAAFYALMVFLQGQKPAAAPA
jgi:hypothetical protein